MTKFQDAEVVRAKCNYSERGIAVGDVEAVSCVFTHPYEAYEVEFPDGKGGVRAIITA